MFPQLFAYIALGLFGNIVSGYPSLNHTSAARSCGSHLSSSAAASAEAHFQQNRLESNADEATIQVYWHVVTAGTDVNDGNIPMSQITDQMDVLNADFESAQLTFDLAGVTYTENAQWYDDAAGGGSGGLDSQYQTAMKQALHVGDAATLNIYSVGFTTSDGLLGYATFPQQYSSFPSYRDGVVVRASSLPGGPPGPFNQGKTLTHEVGHWVGLYHTFQGGCADPGDYVADTPPEASPASGCDPLRDSCPGDGLDPVHNFMDYSDDVCLNNFSSGQVTRLRQQIATYRGIS